MTPAINCWSRVMQKELEELGVGPRSLMMHYLGAMFVFVGYFCFMLQRICFSVSLLAVCSQMLPPFPPSFLQTEG